MDLKFWLRSNFCLGKLLIFTPKLSQLQPKIVTPHPKPVTTEPKFHPKPVTPYPGLASLSPSDKSVPGGHEHVIFSVTDQGIGISDEDQSKLFIPYSQIKPRELQQGHGSGDPNLNPTTPN